MLIPFSPSGLLNPKSLECHWCCVKYYSRYAYVSFGIFCRVALLAFLCSGFRVGYGVPQARGPKKNVRTLCPGMCPFDLHRHRCSLLSTLSWSLLSVYICCRWQSQRYCYHGHCFPVDVTNGVFCRRHLLQYHQHVPRSPFATATFFGDIYVCSSTISSPIFFVCARCFCGSSDKFDRYGTTTCSIPCTGDSSQICGARAASSVYRVD